MQCIGYRADRELFGKVWAIYGNNPKHPIFLKCIIRYFPSEIISVTVNIMMNTFKSDYSDPQY